MDEDEDIRDGQNTADASVDDASDDPDPTDETGRAAVMDHLDRAAEVLRQHPLCTLAVVFAAGILLGKCIGLAETRSRRFPLW
ncbi:hypothetical protein [Tahibacter amnicola]|uniref:Uncharacterized protein n=1 Tax=Tahibacter amnicola TaxID=2976241 RepID=A0ABY6BF30_9GAMM|nr:hypothetical protein [Tahibacter amnicola]UXI66492.1 hypothetical protein N4264_17280 [Tahibacter amnicola]